MPGETINDVACRGRQRTNGFTFFNRHQMLGMPMPRRERYCIHGDVVTIFAASEDTQGSYCFFQTEILSRDSSHVRPHAHRWQDETTFVRDGLFEFLVADRCLVLGPGDVVRIPRGVVHTYRNVGGSPGALWAAIAPAGLEHFFRAAGTTLHGAQTSQSMAGKAVSQRLLRRHGIAV
jgi:mannose-6-phosphate isomerase-like protein (cupin superfamily)